MICSGGATVHCWFTYYRVTGDLTHGAASGEPLNIFASNLYNGEESTNSLLREAAEINQSRNKCKEIWTFPMLHKCFNNLLMVRLH